MGEGGMKTSFQKNNMKAEEIIDAVSNQKVKLKEFAGVAKRIVDNEFRRCRKILNSEVAHLKKPKFYIDESMHQSVGGTHYIGYNIITISPQFFEENKKALKFEGEVFGFKIASVGNTVFTEDSFRTTVRHELAHWAVNGPHTHDSLSFKRYLELLGGSDGVGARMYKRHFWTKIAQIGYFDLRSLFSKKYPRYAREHGTLLPKVIRALMGSHRKYFAVTGSLLLVQWVAMWFDLFYISTAVALFITMMCLLVIYTGQTT